MPARDRVRVALVAGLAAACTAAPERAIDPGVVAVAAAVQQFLRELPPPLQAKARLARDDAEPTRWSFVPGRYAGVEFGELDAADLSRAHHLLRALLSARGFAKTMAVVQLENVLRELEQRRGRDASHRDPARYSLLVRGEPAAEGTFAVRLQGHHVSLHFAFHDGQLAGVTPHFLGSHPHEQRDAGGQGQRVLGREEDLARELLASCDGSQRARVMLAAAAPPDVFLGPGKDFAALGPPQGLPASAMTTAQRDLLWRLVAEYAHNLRGEFAEQELQRLQPDFEQVTFAWAGGTERGQGHYWRVHGRRFAIEYDNTQNDANHVHTVWRGERDFGGDALRQHYVEHHAPRDL